MDSTIYTPVGDQQTAVLGAIKNAGRFADGYILNLGTAGQLCLISDKFICGDFESRPYFQDKTLCTVTHLPAGSYIGVRRDGETLVDMLYEMYADALKKLPVRTTLLAVGGVVHYRRALIETVLKRLGIEYRFNVGGEALEGLKILAEEIQ